MSDYEKGLWATALKGIRRGFDEANDDRFYAVVEQAAGNCDLFVAKTLMGTFSDTFEPDGTQECVNRVLSSATPQIRAQAVLEELARLETEAKEDAEALLEEAVRFFPEVLIGVAAEQGPETRVTLVRMLNDLSKQEIKSGRPDIFAPIILRLGGLVS